MKRFLSLLGLLLMSFTGEARAQGTVVNSVEQFVAVVNRVYRDLPMQADQTALREQMLDRFILNAELNLQCPGDKQRAEDWRQILRTKRSSSPREVKVYLESINNVRFEEVRKDKCESNAPLSITPLLIQRTDTFKITERYEAPQPKVEERKSLTRYWPYAVVTAALAGIGCLIDWCRDDDAGLEGDNGNKICITINDPSRCPIPASKSGSRMNSRRYLSVLQLPL